MKQLKEAYIGYIDHDGTPRGIKLATIKSGMKASNVYSLDYIHFIANALNFIIGRIMYFLDRNNRPISEVIITDDMLAEYIGCHPNHSPRVLKSLKDIFGLKYTRQHFKGGARTITINRTLIDFMGIFSDAELYSFIERNKINSKQYRALQQMYRYRVFGVKPSSNQLKPSQEKARKEFVRRNNDFYHHVSTSNQNDYTRIDFIKSHSDKLSNLKKAQLDRITEEKKKGKLSSYFFRLLVRIEQFISNLLKKDKKNEAGTVSEDQPQLNENPNGMSAAHESAIAEATLSIDDYNMITDTWNNMCKDDPAVPAIPGLTKEEKKLINVNVESNTIERVIKAINNVPNLEHDKQYKFRINFRRFISNPEHTYWISNLNDKKSYEPDWVEEVLNTL